MTQNKEMITLGPILLMAAQNKLRWGTDAHRYSSELLQLILRCWAWFPGRRLGVSLRLPGVHAASIMTHCKTNAVHNFSFLPSFIKAKILWIYFRVRKQTLKQIFIKVKCKANLGKAGNTCTLDSCFKKQQKQTNKQKNPKHILRGEAL